MDARPGSVRHPWRTQDMRRLAAIIRSDDGARAFLCLQMQRGAAYPEPYDYNLVNADSVSGKLMPSVLVSAPYIIPELDRFRPTLRRLGIELLVANVRNGSRRRIFSSTRADSMGALCGDDPTRPASWRPVPPGSR